MAQEHEFRIKPGYGRGVEFQDSMEAIQPQNGRSYAGTLKTDFKTNQPSLNEYLMAAQRDEYACMQALVMLNRALFC